MNILFLYSNSIIPERGGVQRVTAVLADELSLRGHNIFYLSLPQNRVGGEDKDRQFYLPDCDFFTTRNCRFLEDFISSKKIDVVINQDGFSPASVNLLECVKGKTIILSVLHNSPLAKILNFSSAFSPRFPKFLRGFLYLTDLSVVKSVLLFLYKLKYRNHYKRLLSVSDRVVLLSDGFKKEVAFFDVPSMLMKKVVSVHNPCSFQKEQGVEKKNQLLYVGRLELGQKRVDLLVDVWARLYRRFPEWSLVIVGEGPDSENLKKRVRDLKLPRVVFEGRKSSDPYYSCAKIFCMTSSYEGFPMVLPEAMNYNCVPVAFESFASVKDIIEDGRTGLLISPFDCDCYAERVSGLMKNEDFRAKLATNGKVFVSQKFSVEHIVDCWETLFSEVLNKKTKKK